jgi:hypothetical protein
MLSYARYNEAGCENQFTEYLCKPGMELIKAIKFKRLAVISSEVTSNIV